MFAGFSIFEALDLPLQNDFRVILVVPEKNQIERTFEFDDFVDAIDFVDRVAEVAEEEEHHPDIDIRYNKVRLAVSTHSKGGLTELDFNLAERIDTLEE